MGRRSKPLVALVLVVTACAPPPDHATESPDGSVSASCGNGRLDPGESCDVAIPAGQPGACPIACEDGNTCTNDRVDGTDCAATCTHDVISNCCGNGVLEAGEACDDGNQLDFDGCSHNCRIERALVWHTMQLLDGSQGCDLDGDGTIDNAFGGALNDTARQFYSNIVSQTLDICDYASVWVLTGNDPSMQQPFDFAIVSGMGLEQPPNTDAYFSGHNQFQIVRDALDDLGQAPTPLTGSAPSGMLSVGPGRMTMLFPWCNSNLWYVKVEYYHFRLGGVITTGSDGPTDFSAMVCEARSAASWYRVPNGSGLGNGTTLLDLIVLGADFLGFHSEPTQPDIDVDSDGFERFEDTDSDGTIDLCIDGNGTQIIGTDCPLDPRIADAYSEAMRVGGVRGVLAGRKP